MTGRHFGQLLGIGSSHASRGGRAQWPFACDCGAETVAGGGNVWAGKIPRDQCRPPHDPRAPSRKRHEATYRAWQPMNDSCGNSMSGGSRRCGARGIGVSPLRQSDFLAFLADMGERPTDAVLAKVDPNAVLPSKPPLDEKVQQVGAREGGQAAPRDTTPPAP